MFTFVVDLPHLDWAGEQNRAALLKNKKITNKVRTAVNAIEEES